MECPGLVSGGQPGKPLRPDTEKRSLVKYFPPVQRTFSYTTLQELELS